MATTRESLVEDVIQAQKQIFMAMRAAAEPNWLGLDLTMGQLKGLLVLAHEGAIPMGHLAIALGVGKPAASILVERLVELGLVERSEDTEDRRRTFARLSLRGAELIAQFRQVVPGRLRAWLNAMADDDLAALKRGLAALTEASRVDAPAGCGKAQLGGME